MTNQNFFGGRLPKKHRFRPQNNSGSLAPKKLLKVVNCATIKETKKLKETMVVVQVELAGGHQYVPRSPRLTMTQIFISFLLQYHGPWPMAESPNHPITYPY